MKLLSLFTIAIGALFAAGFGSAQEETAKYEIADIMKKCLKDDPKIEDDGLCKKVATGNASDGEKRLLVEMLTVLTQLKPPKESPEDPQSWQKKTADLLAAAKSVVAGDDGAGVKLANAANCKACHSAHRIK